MMKQTFTVPIVFNRCKTKVRNFWLNLNGYTQIATCTGARNGIKKTFQALIKDDISKLKPINKPFRVEYKIYRETAHKFDIDNVGAIVSKFVMDALVENKIIPDDNYEWLKEVTIKYGGREETRADVTIEVIDE